MTWAGPVNLQSHGSAARRAGRMLTVQLSRGGCRRWRIPGAVCGEQSQRLAKQGNQARLYNDSRKAHRSRSTAMQCEGPAATQPLPADGDDRQRLEKLLQGQARAHKGRARKHTAQVAAGSLPSAPALT